MKNVLLKFVAIYCVLVLHSCTFQQKIKDGEMAYERKQYAVAIDMLAQEYEEARIKEMKAQKAFKLGKSMMQLLRYKDAEQWYRKAMELDYGPTAMVALGQVLKNQERYAEAISTFEKIGDEPGYKQEAQKEILLCNQSLTRIKSNRDYTIKRMGMNELVSEYAPTPYDQQFIVFTSEGDEASGKSTYTWTGQKYSDLFVMPKDGSEVRRFDAVINTPANEGAAVFSRDMNTMFFNRCYSTNGGDDFCKIMMSQRINDVWSEPILIPFVVEGFQYKHPALIENDSVLVFSSDLTEAGGPFDLYYSALGDNGAWSTPDPFPSSINTAGNEIFPTGEGDTLYYSSDYLPGMGGFDIFKSYIKSNGSWSTPQALAYPINSGGDDFSYFIDRSNADTSIIEKGYFSSSRIGVGKDDIFYFEKKKSNKPKTLEPTDSGDDFTIFVAVYTKTKGFEDPLNPNSRFVKNEVLPNAFVKISRDDKTSLLETTTNAQGYYVYEAKEKKNLILTGSKPGYLNASVNVALDNVRPKDGEKTVTVNVDIILDKIFENKEVNIPDIYYAYDKWDLRPESLPILDKLVKILSENPQVNIELLSHTDCRGDDMYNDELSQKRAQSVIDYLISKGIGSNRLIAKGMGERSLVETCVCEACSEAQHQANRRTTFIIRPRK